MRGAYRGGAAVLSLVRRYAVELGDRLSDRCPEARVTGLLTGRRSELIDRRSDQRI